MDGSYVRKQAVEIVAAPDFPTCSFARSFDILKYTRCYSQELLNNNLFRPNKADSSRITQI